ncbi:MAG: efflux RND transporter periplasmic adaptor subunit [Trueperaceae bacterium]|nr:efflux RND transporter periplasmic adaptor subunit [Trueperaceae bacterium]
MATQLRTHHRSRRKGRRRWLIILTLLALATVAAGVWYIYLRDSGEIAVEATGPETISVFPQLYRETVSGTGTLEPWRSLDLAFDVSGTIVELVEVGQRVEQGDVIASLNTTSFERSLRDAEFALEQARTKLSSTASSQSESQVSLQESITSSELSVQDAQREVERAQTDLELKQSLQAVGSESFENVQLAQDAYNRMLDNLSKAELNLTTLRESQSLRSNANEQDLRNTELSVQAAELSLERAQEDLAATTLIAPFDGVVASLNVSEGNNVSASGVILTLIDDSRVKLEAQIDETEISLISLGLSAEVELDAVSGQSFTGEVTTISPIARTVSNIPIFDVTITLDNAQGLMRSGMTAEAEILIREVENTVSVPSRAVQTVRNRSYVEVLGEDGAFALQPVSVIATSGLNTIVQANFAPNSQVLVPALEQEATSNNEDTNGGSGLPFLGGPGR